ncbi:MAG: cytochrome c biogenesis protein ResB [Desulfobacterales bacterium]|nr:cytochrome c biogenesis protein ResB [Desulfobacterales bacterium]
MPATTTPSDGLAGAIWGMFASVRLTIVLLLSLATTSIVGTLIPQNSDPAAYVSAFGETLYRFFAVLGLFDMYHSWWFQVLMLLLAANVVVCSIDRISSQRKVLFVRRPRFKAERFRDLPDRVVFEDARPPEALRALYERFLARKTGALQVEVIEGGFRIFGERGRWTRFGVYAVHLSVVLLLVGGLIGSIFGFDAFVNIPEGETVQQVILRNSGQRLRLPFAIRCDDFDVSFYDTGAPKEFRSALTILENGQPVLQKDIVVNDPLRYRGISIFQSSYGSLPSDEAVLSFTSRETGMVYARDAKIGREIALPEGLGTFTLTEIRHEAQFRGHPVGDAFIGRLVPPNGQAEEIVLPIRFPTFDRMRRGEVVIAVDQFKQRHYTGLQVNQDPGVDVVYAGFLLMIIGCYVTFFTSHRQVCVEVVRRGTGAEVTVAGKANKNKTGVGRLVGRLSASLKALA